MPGGHSCQQPLIKSAVITVTQSQGGIPLLLNIAHLSTIAILWAKRDRSFVNLSHLEKDSREGSFPLCPPQPLKTIPLLSFASAPQTHSWPGELQ